MNVRLVQKVKKELVVGIALNKQEKAREARIKKALKAGGYGTDPYCDALREFIFDLHNKLERELSLSPIHKRVR